MRRLLFAASMLGALFASPVHAQDSLKFKFSHWVIPNHPISVWIQKWADDLRTKSGGKIDIQVFPNAQLGPSQDTYDMVRRGTVDMGWILHGITSDRFPLTTLNDIPFLSDTGEMGSTIINNAELRSKYLDPEARGIKNLILFTNQPANMFTANRAVRTPADLKGLKMRFPSVTSKRLLEELGASTVGIPGPQLAESLQQGVIDGTLIDYGGAGISFKLGGLLKYGMEIRAYTSSFAIVMNPDSYAKLQGPLKEMFDKSVADKGGELGRAMDSIDGAGRQALVAGGMQVITFSDADMAPFREAGKRVADAEIAEREKKGLPARDVYNLFVKAAADYKASKK